MSNAADTPSLVASNPWSTLKQFTPARIALGLAGSSLPTAPQLEFQLAHARARDAVYHELDTNTLTTTLRRDERLSGWPCVVLHSAAADRLTYLKRPDQGRTLHTASRDALLRLKKNTARTQFDVAFVIVDGLSARAVETQALPVLKNSLERLTHAGFTVAPITIITHGRVAIADEVGELLGAKLVVVMIGERPGLSTPHSMGMYLTWDPKRGLTDESRNCISNIHADGLSHSQAEEKLYYLISQAHRRRLSGIDLKDETDIRVIDALAPNKNFLVSESSHDSASAPPEH